MGYKDILVYAGSGKSAATRFDAAARLALSQDARLTALHVDQTRSLPAELMVTGVAAQVRQWQKTVEAERIEKARAIVSDASQRHGLPIEWRQQEGELEDVIRSQAVYADLIVVSQPGSPLDMEQPIEPSPGALALSSGRPVMVVPSQAGAYQVGGNVLIAWRPSAEAARAVHDALPILQKARAVTVLEVNPEMKQGSDRLVGAEIAQHLARHGVKVSAQAINNRSVNPGSTILARAAEIQADLIVMGGYGHTRLREIILGGATDHILKHHHVPILMAH